MGRDWSTAQDRELGHELRKRREAAGLTGVELARQMGTTPTKISRMERGTRASSTVDVISYLAFCDVEGPAAEVVVALTRKPDRNIGYWLSPYGHRLPDSLNSLIYHEATADASTIYQAQSIPGLLQTSDYARAWIAAEPWRSIEDIEQCVRIRMERQRVLHAHRLAYFTFFLHEHALRVHMGSAAIMHEQMLNLVLLSALDHVTVRVVLSTDAGPWAFGGPFHVLEYLKHQPLVYLDNHATGLFLEDPDYLEPYRSLIPAIAATALDEGQSREWIAALASGYDQGSGQDVDHRVEEEQL